VLHDFLKDLITKLGYSFNSRRVPFKAAYYAAYIMEWLSRACFAYKEPFLTTYTAGVLAYSRTFDISLAKKDLGYYPRVSIQDGVQELVRDWRKEHGCLR
jgi:nucleoside-diphosphate-sugar epimerase